ncbi:MAG: 1,4-dihydroxy-6-naphthoate synthase [Chitinophagaceae bacterium]|nr:1,4-dihydroxy-6-naphthoate synthase [Chitinophagaceae bacterium]
MELSLAFSPCPNDTFIFDALVNSKIDTEGLSFTVYLEDVQTLNEWALAGKIDISKISYGVWPSVMDHYDLLRSGGALGMGVGPLLITQKEKKDIDINNATVAIPGEHTTAHFLFSMAYPNAKQKIFKVFHEIEDAVIQGEVDAGVIIHENRFTYAQKGLYKLVDLGAFWEETLHIPIPLGGIVAHKRIDKAIVQKLDQLIKKSIEYAYLHYPHISEYVKMHSQEMSESVMRQHIDLYVNKYSLDLGEDGLAAVSKLEELRVKTIDHRR